MRRLLAAVLLFAACSRGPEVPVNTLLWRVEGWAQTSAGKRRARAKMVIFRKNGEYVEYLSYVIEQPDTTIFISAFDPHVVTSGKWTSKTPEIFATHEVIARPVPFAGAVDPLCSDVKFTISGNSVIGSDGHYSPLTRLVAPDFESNINDALAHGRPCPPPAN